MSHKIPQIWVIEIDPHAQLITQTTYPMNVDVAKELGHSSLDTVRIDLDHHMIVDDNGLLHKENMYFTLNITKLLKLKEDTEDRILSLCGKTMLVRVDEDGNLMSCDYKLHKVVESVGWLPKGYRDEPYMEFIDLENRVIH